VTYAITSDKEHVRLCNYTSKITNGIIIRIHAHKLGCSKRDETVKNLRMEVTLKKHGQYSVTKGRPAAHSVNEIGFLY
jgi:hypothetical protein